MSILNLFSRRQKLLRGEVPDVYTYSELPNALKVQIVQIVMETLGDRDCFHIGEVEGTYKYIVEALRRERGVFRLPPRGPYDDHDSLQELANYFLNEKNCEQALDVVELCFRAIDTLTRDWSYRRSTDGSERADNAIRELNARFQHHGIGYQFLSGEIIRVDSELLHAEVVKPVLGILREKRFSGAQQEFLSAHEHYRHGRNKEALVDCLKSLESLMKAVCDKKKWKYPPTATAKNLIDICFQNNLIPAFWQSHFSSLRSLLESGVPTARNKLGGHGQGSDQIVVPSHLVSYVIHVTAATMLLLAEADATK